MVSTGGGSFHVIKNSNPPQAARNKAINNTRRKVDISILIKAPVPLRPFWQWLTRMLARSGETRLASRAYAIMPIDREFNAQTMSSPIEIVVSHHNRSGGQYRLLAPVVLVGLMGAGKTAIGRRLGARLNLPFRDSDDAVIEAAGMSIADIFEMYGETEFRDLERRVIARIMTEEPAITALGGGAFIDDETRILIKDRAISIWIDADLDTLVERTARKPGKRPLLMKGNPREILAGLMENRYPIYAQANYRIMSGAPTPEHLVEEIVELLTNHGHLQVSER